MASDSVMPMTAADLARALDADLIGPDVEIGGIAVDSRDLRPGDLFVVQRGARDDGARFVADARTVVKMRKCYLVGPKSSARISLGWPIIRITS